jgi:serine/threonine protein kinase
MTKASYLLYEGKEVKVNIEKIRRIKIVRHLGSGGFADVWKVRDLDTSKHYALKHIRVKVEEDAAAMLVRRISNEASINIPSRYVVICLGLRELDAKNFVLLFPFVEGTDLSDWIVRNKGASWKTKKRLYIEILKGVSDAHRLNVIHRDLKPGNILVTAGGVPKIIDFGLAKIKDRGITVTGDWAGTLPYMDPNALLHGIKYVDARADVYAMGVILHELVTGMNYLLANGIEFGDLVRAIAKEGRQNILDLDPGFSFPDAPEVEHIVRQSTMFNPSRRTNTINDMIRQLGITPRETPDIVVDFDITSPVLVVEDGSAKGSMNMITIPDNGVRELGRSNLDATNSTLSKSHAAIVRKKNRYYLYDAGSKNGTYLNGSFVGVGEENMVEIKHTDRIRFADLWTRFVFLKA